MLDDNIAEQFFGDPKKLMLLTGYNCFYHLELFNNLSRYITEEQYRRCQNSIMLVNWDLGIFAVFVVCESDKAAEVKASVDLCNLMLKAIYNLFHESIKNTGITLYAGIYLPKVKRCNLGPQGGYSFLNSDFSSTKVDNFMMFIAEHEQPNLVLFQENLSKLRGKTKLSAESAEKLQGIAYQMMSIMALTDGSLPSFGGDVTERIKTLLFNQDQWKVVNYRHPLKIIKACYGSGKTLVLKRIARNIFMQHEKGSVFYLCFDPFSLLDVQIHKDFEKWKEEKLSSRVKLTSLNLKGLATELQIDINDMFHSIEKPNFRLSKLLKRLRNKESCQTTFLIDEFPSEALETNLRDSIPDDTNVVIALHSTRKVVQLYKEGNLVQQSANTTAPEYALPSGCKLFALTKSMRMCEDLFDLVKVAKECIKPSEVSLVIPQQGSLAEQSAENSVVENQSTSTHNESADLESSHNFYTTPKSEEETKKGTKVEVASLAAKTQLSMTIHDPSAIPDLVGDYLHNNLVGSKVVVTPHLDKESKSGTTIQSGVKPQLVFLPEEFDFCPQSGDLLAVILQTVCSINQASTIICSSVGEIVITKYALESLGKKVTVFAPYLYQSFPSMGEKEVVLTELTRNGFFLITDYRSFR